ncbi:hypothetical protein Sango_1208500 [Sesamum angolense]|uniref:Uncharacterized protein n=1 Tax=Sesamum angolense TaxID=2727404 RepID=A0AAE1WXG3_9LAMI|nr:hypothetical protein Sango_1208500 [Sesamum angolense]
MSSVVVVVLCALLVVHYCLRVFHSESGYCGVETEFDDEMPNLQHSRRQFDFVVDRYSGQLSHSLSARFLVNTFEISSVVVVVLCALLVVHYCLRVFHSESGYCGVETEFDDEMPNLQHSRRQFDFGVDRYSGQLSHSLSARFLVNTFEISSVVVVVLCALLVVHYCLRVFHSESGYCGVETEFDYEMPNLQHSLRQFDFVVDRYSGQLSHSLSARFLVNTFEISSVVVVVLCALLVVHYCLRVFHSESGYCGVETEFNYEMPKHSWRQFDFVVDRYSGRYNSCYNDRSKLHYKKLAVTTADYNSDYFSTDEGSMCHPFDAEAWKHFDRTFGWAFAQMVLRRTVTGLNYFAFSHECILDDGTRSYPVDVDRSSYCYGGGGLYDYDKSGLVYCFFNIMYTADQPLSDSCTTQSPAVAKRLYSSRATAEEMTWHATHQTNEGSMCHPSDAEVWKHFDRMYPAFAGESRDVWLGLCTDGFAPHSQYDHTYSCWPVIITSYTLLPGMCMSFEYIFLTMNMVLHRDKGMKMMMTNKDDDEDNSGDDETDDDDHNNLPPAFYKG